MPTEALDYYQVLQISPKADPEIVKAAYYTLLKTLKKHPDLGGSNGEATLINEAYEILGDPFKRQEYDKQFLKGLISSASSPQANPFVPHSDAEQRKYRRAIFQNIFQFRLIPNDFWFEAQFRDISLSGACFRTQKSFQIGDTLELNLCDKPPLRPTAKVCWVRPLPQRFGIPLFEGGVLFKTIDTFNYRRFLFNSGLGFLLTDKPL